MTRSDEIRFAHYDAATAGPMLETVVGPIFLASHTDVGEDPFYGLERFLERVRGYLRSPAFELVTAVSGAEPVALALGYALPEGARWWQGLTTPIEAGLIREDGRRTFALCEIMVHPDWQRQGIARAVHDELMHHRPERRATLLVREDNAAAQAAYASWGWTKIGKLRPYADAPNYDALVLDLLTRPA
ncbi:GNAT family N-acetyltransferase [Dactylosporangium sp. NPDC051541]|uniref:GNAT family N-acetyltransferase n=1 Tax=Dactylosporangium sp. NPDC051541 TaxID=3363977 RepID=UPI00379606E4